MINHKLQIGIWILGFGILLPLGSQAAWTEPSSAPPGGNVGVPIYSSAGVAQTMDSSLTVGAIGTATTLQGAGTAIGVQGRSPQYAVYGETTAGAPSGYAGVYGTAADSTDFSGNFSGGAGIVIQGGTIPTLALPTYVQLAEGQIVSTGGYALGGDVRFNTANTGLVWKRLDGNWLLGVGVNAGVLTVKGFGSGISFTDQNGNARLTISELGTTNIVSGPLSVAGQPVCLQDGTGCPAQITPTLQAVTTAGNSTTNSLDLRGALSNSTGDLVVNDWVDVQWGVKNSTANNGGSLYISDDLKVTGGGAFGGYDPSGTHKVTTPTLYAEQGQVGAATGGLKGAGTLNAVQLCIQGSCINSWSQAGTNLWANEPFTGGIYATNIGNDVAIGQGNTWSWAGDSDLFVKGGIRGTRYYDDDINYYADLNAGGTLGGDWTFKGRVINLQNSVNNHYYIDSWNGIQLRVDSDNNSLDDFRVNNGANSTVLTVDEGGNLAASGNITASGQSVCRQDGTNCPGGANLWSLSGSNLYPANLTNNVGIGTAAPGYKLQVSGDAKITGGGAFGGYDPSVTHKVTTPTFYSEQAQIGGATGGLQGAGTVNAVKLCIQGDCKANWAAVATSSGWTDDGTVVRTTTATDQVAIGTNNPTIYQLYVDNSGPGGQLGALGVTGPTSLFGQLVVAGNSNVGVGALSPAYRLDVVDNNSTSIVNFNSDDASLYWTGVRLARQGSEKWFLGVDNSTDKLLFRRGGSTNDVVIDTAGNVGIGTASPNKQLHVKTASGNAEIDIQSALSAYWAMYQDDSTDQLRFWNNSISGEKNALVLDDNGNIGIGITDPTNNPPQYKLHVKGDVGVGWLGAIQSPNNSASLLLLTDDTSGDDYAVVSFRRGNGGGRGWNVGMNDDGTHNFKIQSRIDGGPNRDQLTINSATGYVKAVSGLCLINDSTCKTGDWGAVPAAYGVNGGDAGQNPEIPGVREYRVLPSGFNSNYYFCPPGFVVIGFRNTSPGELICGKMW